MLSGQTITEGKTKLFVPEKHSVSGPGKKESDEVFFNEQMAFNRDVSVMLLNAIGRPKISVADQMSATGARQVRIGNEVPGTEVIANDISPLAKPYIEENIRINNLDNVSASCFNMISLFAENSFDYVDLDPFGSPSLFIQSAIRGTRKRGIVAITATDTAPLDGAQAAKCRRRYQCEPVRGYLCHEGGLRILLCNIQREVGKFDIGMRPLLCFFMDHYYRCFVELVPGTDACDEMLSNLGYLGYDQKTLFREQSETKDKEHPFGPFWNGPLFDKDLISKFKTEETADTRRCEKYKKLWTEETDSVPFLYDLSELSRFTKLSPPTLSDLLVKLNETGKATATHFSPTSFVTDLPLKEIITAYSEIGHTLPSN